MVYWFDFWNWIWFLKTDNANTTVYAKFEEDEALSSDTSVKKVSPHKGIIGQTVPTQGINIDSENGVITITIAKTHQIGDVVQVQIDEVADRATASPNPVKRPNWNFTVTAEDGTIKEYTIKFEQELSDNTNLKSLTVAGKDVPVKDGQTEYEVQLPEGTDLVETLAITATPKHGKATVSEVTKVNNNQYTFVVTAEDGTKTTYTVNVKVAEGAGADEVEETETVVDTEPVEENV